MNWIVAVVRRALVAVSFGLAGGLAVIPVGSALAQALGLPGLEADAQGYASALRAKGPPKLDQKVIDDAALQAAQAVAGHDMGRAVQALERAVAARDDRPTTWMALAQAQASLSPPNLARALQAGWLGSLRAAPGRERLDNMLWLARLLDGAMNRPENAIAAYRDALDEAKEARLPQPEAQRRLAELRLALGLTLKRVSASSDEQPARLCLTFSDRLKSGRDIRFEDFVQLEPPAQVTAAVDDNQLCLSGVSHGTTYQVTVRQGLPGADSMVFKHDEATTIRVDDRSPSVAFRGDQFILVRGDNGGIPVVTVNLDSVKLKLNRINDRNLVGQLKGDALRSALGTYDVRRLRDSEGELIWEGKLAVASGGRNQETVTGFAVRTLIPETKPGLYVITAEPVDVPGNDQRYIKATQWLMISDLGLTTTRGADGVHVFVRSLASAKPAAGIGLTLVARNNSELGRAVTDAEGHAVFGPGLSRGVGGQSALMVTASGADGDFALIDLSLAAFDLSDRGVGGRAVPGPLDAYLYSDRGVYRPGETVNLTALLRDDRTAAVEGFPLTLKVLRPSGTEFYAGTLKPAAAGGFTLPLALTKTAPLGGWQVLAYGDPKRDPIGRLSFQVEEFVPERLAVELAAFQPAIEPGLPFEVGVTSRFLYGPPAAGLGGTAEVALGEDPDPYPQFKGFHFGLAQEQVTARVSELILPAGDAEGKARLAVELPPQPDTTKPLRAAIRVAVTEPGGRPTRKSIFAAVRTQPYAIGIRPRFDGDRLGEGQGAGFEIIAIDRQGNRIVKPSLRWELIAEHRDFQWYHENGRYKYRVTERDHSVRAGTAAIPAATAAVQDLGTLAYGRFRFEVSDAATGVATSFRFSSGWEAGPSASDTPDTLEVTADRPVYGAGETAHLIIRPPFAGEVLLTVATDRLLLTRTLSVEKGGTRVDVAVDAAWGPGAYVTATVYRPPVHGKERQPVRAIGLTWLTIDPAPRTINLSINTPEVVRPRQTVEVPITATFSGAVAGAVAGAGAGADVYVTLAAVDEGILQLTEFASPDPGKHFFGKRELGLDIRDDYGRLIDTIDSVGALRQGGDGMAGGLPKVPFTVLSLFQGPVKLDAQGKAIIRLALPEFNGQLRLMAVAYDRTRIGSASRKLVVRDALVADATLPRFIAPGDDSQMTISLHNVEAVAGRYRVTVSGLPPVRVVQPVEGSLVDLARDARLSLVLPLTGDSSGVGGVVVAVNGPVDGPADGPAMVAVRQELPLTVRSSRPEESEFTARLLAPGAEAVADISMLAAYVPGSAGLSLSFSSAPPFDVGGLLAALDRYPYGCLEQLVSRALPLLVVADVAGALGARLETGTGPNRAEPALTLAARVDQAIARVLDKQRFDGAFGVWSANGEAAPWLTAYAMEFLTRARALKYAVPETPYLAGLTWLRAHAIDGGSDKAGLVSRAYALNTLALAGVLTPGPVRYFADAFGDQLPTPLARGQLGAALARLGDRDRAEVAFAGALSGLARESWPEDYGSTVRDAAALVTIASEAGMADRNRLPALIDRLPASAAAVRETNTQEQAWLVLAADSLMKGAAPLALTMADRPLAKADPVRLEPTLAQLSGVAGGIKVRNAGRQPVWQAVSSHGVPLVPRPALREGMKIRRNFFWRDGTAVNLDLVKQNDVFVIVLEGEAGTKLFHQALVTQSLAAGWEIENKALGAGGLEGMGWLGKLSEPLAAELRDDRYVAAINLTETSPQFKLAFMVRAVTPGGYELPGARLEDMYKSRFFARQAVGRVTILSGGEGR